MIEHRKLILQMSHSIAGTLSLIGPKCLQHNPLCKLKTNTILSEPGTIGSQLQSSTAGLFF